MLDYIREETRFAWATILEWIKEYQKEVMIIGGEAIYREIMKDAEKLLFLKKAMV